VVPAVADIDTPPAVPGVDQAPAAAVVVVDHRVHVPVAAVEGDAVKSVDAVEPDNAHTAMADEVAATETANGEPVATEAMATESMAAESMAATMAAATAAATTAAGVGDLRQRDDDGDKHCKHQIDELTTHDTLLLQAFFSRRHRRARIMAKLRRCRSYLSQ
jgi:hypothetical protein